ncbi:Vacuolar inheritance and morphology protein [Pseudogymnoascus australis]
MEDKPLRNPSQAPEMTQATPSSMASKSANPQTTSPTQTRKPSHSPAPGSKRIINSQPPSNTASPKPSREPSPARPTVRSATVRAGGNGRSRKSSQEPSPSRSASATAANMPSSAAVQRALSTANTPLLKPSTSDTAIVAPQPQKITVPTEFKDSPRWPISPRLKSPPPINRPTGMARKTDQELPPISTLRFQTSNESAQSATTDTDYEESSAMSGIRSPGRGVSTSATTLETVPESSQPGSPGIGMGLERSQEWKKGGLPEEQIAIDQAFTKNMKSSPAAVTTDSGSESGEKKGEIKLRPTSGANTTPRPNAAQLAKQASSSALAGKKGIELSAANNMTVETETVSSIPQVAVGGGTGAGVNGSLRTKPSSETIRPKKEKRKSARKPHSVANGVGETPDSSSHRSLKPPRLHHHPSLLSISTTASANTPPSESSRPATALGHFPHPPPAPTNLGPLRLSHPQPQRHGQKTNEPPRSILKSRHLRSQDRHRSRRGQLLRLRRDLRLRIQPPDHERPRRFHSRTPSTTSMASQSQAEPRPGPPSRLANNLDSSNGHSVAMKKSMKFASSFAPPPTSDAATDDDASQRALGTGRGTIRHHHIGRWGRNNNSSSHASLFDAESPFPLATKPSKFGNSNSMRQSSRPTSPRNGAGGRTLNGNGNGTVRKGGFAHAYDIDDGAGADDERTPLVGSGTRSTRSRHRRNPPPSQRQRNSRSPFGACLILGVMFVLVVSGALALLLGTTQPLGGVRIAALRDVLASKTELLLDVDVVARNPNVFAVGVDKLDVSVYAKSSYAGDEALYARMAGDGRALRHGSRGSADGGVGGGEVQIRDDSPWDPYPPPPSDKPLLLLGRLTSTDTALSFPASPFRHAASLSTAALRLQDPGNSTEGRARWDRVLKSGHGWELILQGVVEYRVGWFGGWGAGSKKIVPVGAGVEVGGGGEDGVVFLR